MRAPRLIAKASILCVVLLASTRAAQAAPVTFATRALFNSAVGTQVVDTFNTGYGTGNVSNVGIVDRFTDAAMSAVLGETDYTSLNANSNFVFDFPTQPGPNRVYCGGCTNSFRLTFTSTSVGSSDGVYGVAFDITTAATNSNAFVTFGDGSTAGYALAGLTFFGLTSSVLIDNIHFGTITGGTSNDAIHIDNLTIAADTAVPEPATLSLLGLGLAGAAVRRFKRRK